MNRLEKRFFVFISVLLIMVIAMSLLAGCGGEEEESSEGETSSAIVYPEIAPSFTLDKKILENSLLSVGNNRRMSDFFLKVVSDEEVDVLYFGGSASYGLSAAATGSSGYNILVNDWLTSNFPGSNIRLLNMGISGTSSILGAARVTRDVINHEPDLVIIDFAADDLETPEDQIAFESIVASILESESAPAVALLFSSRADGYSGQFWMEQIGTEYSLPMISMCNSIYRQIEEGKMEWAEYSNDSALPNADGHVMLSELIIYWLDTVYKNIQAGNIDEEPIMPEYPLYGDAMKNSIFMDSANYKPASLGSFSANRTKNINFPNSWHKKANSGNKSMVFKVNTRSMVVFYKQIYTGDYGDLDVFVNGELYTTLNGSSGPSWDSISYSQIIFDQFEDREYTVEFKMAAGSENKEFLIFGVSCAPPISGT